jgi:hypothetical protein
MLTYYVEIENQGKNVLNVVNNCRHSLHYAARRKSLTAMVTEIFLPNWNEDFE